MILCSCSVFPNKTRNLSLLPLWTVSARQGPHPGRVFPYRHRTMTLNPVVAIPGSFMEIPESLHPLLRRVFPGSFD